MDGMHTTAASADMDGRGLAIAAPGLVETFPAAAPAQRSEATKRAMDIALTLLMLVPLAPVMAVVALLIRLRSGRQILVRHERIGRDGVPFPCLKFRTMVRDADRVLEEHLARDPAARAEWQAQRKLARDPRVTAIGNLLRRSSLDELPQLFNVLRGEMSLVGPRPVVRVELEEHYAGEAGSLYCRVRPGVTGLWQVSGRSGVSYRERVRLDTEYVRTGSLMLDVAILCRTPWAVLRARGAC
ncbi:sugar transferase [Neoroseomonas oryzicola]|uniref:Sugar transferase n=1 Tax=Neoroseomonas oryzicola TaxID=535904 RepID=A0A9X9WHT8_9PROT|nr:sugar transferase [Neoroseomonas oryzicola]MBR0659898.1 sugar transferase [Neoroseomonas oryzicola]NKE15662.1 sugar transferase [Neoroseomonas oryzicola]